MKTYRMTLIATLLGVVAAWATPGVAQADSASNSGLRESSTDSVLKNRIRSSDRLLTRVLENPDLVSEELQTQVEELQASLDAIREAWLTEYRPGEDATAEEIKAAREAFQEAYAEDIEANKELRIAVMTELRAEYRDRVDSSEWSEKAKALYQEYNDGKQELAEAWASVRESLGEDATRADIVAARERFRVENADLIAAQKELAAQIRELIREKRGGPAMGRGPYSDELRALRGDVANLRQQVRERSRQAREDMQGMSTEEREEYRRAVLDELKDLHDDIKQTRRRLIEELRDGQDGDRRPEG